MLQHKQRRTNCTKQTSCGERPAPRHEWNSMVLEWFMMCIFAAPTLRFPHVHARAVAECLAKYVCSVFFLAERVVCRRDAHSIHGAQYSCAPTCHSSGSENIYKYIFFKHTNMLVDGIVCIILRQRFMFAPVSGGGIIPATMCASMFTHTHIQPECNGLGFLCSLGDVLDFFCTTLLIASGLDTNSIASSANRIAGNKRENLQVLNIH